jgi:hypothetical protein
MPDILDICSFKQRKNIMEGNMKANTKTYINGPGTVYCFDCRPLLTMKVLTEPHTIPRTAGLRT